MGPTHPSAAAEPSKEDRALAFRLIRGIDPFAWDEMSQRWIETGVEEGGCFLDTEADAAAQIATHRAQAERQAQARVIERIVTPEVRDAMARATRGTWATTLDGGDLPRAIVSLVAPRDSLLGLDREGMAIVWSVDDAHAAVTAVNTLRALAKGSLKS